MRSETYLALLKLKEELKNDERIIFLLEKEKEMESSSEVQLLSYKKDIALSHYNSLLNIYNEDHEEALKARKDLYLKKKELEEHPLVREYLKAYSVVRNLLDDVDKILFEDYSINLCHK